ncbi:AtpZ/AtpI family protein [Candidatus Sumerlaeota bacterium]|nr:AtpZ/AtpI family protein [Candidatus Sumerlaeota bacterium]
MKDGGDPGKERRRQARFIGTAVTLPFLMLAAPLVGLFGGRWLDERFGTEDLLTIIGVVLGLAAGGYQAYLLIREMMKDLD